jgi:hypothetical protein
MDSFNPGVVQFTEMQAKALSFDAGLGQQVPAGRLVFLGDSLTFAGSPGRAPTIFDGRTWWINTSLSTPTNFQNFVVTAMLDGGAGPAGGTLASDAQGRLSWAYSGDSAGSSVDCSTGGWFYLPSGTLPNSGILVAIRGGTTPPLSVSSAVTTAGLKYIQDFNLIGFPAWVAGAMGEYFSDYQVFAMSGATSTDVMKFAPQTFSKIAEAAIMLVGVNDGSTTAAQATSVAANIVATLDIALTSSRRVYVVDIFPYPAGSATTNRFNNLVGTLVRKAVAMRPRSKFLSSFGDLVSPQASGTAVGKSGVFHTDNLHLMPFGAYIAAKQVVNQLRADFGFGIPRRDTVGTWDSTLKVGSWGPNPCLRGTGGTVTAGHGITGTAPDNWTVARVGSTQLCTTSFEAASDGGIDWWAMSLTSPAAGAEHTLTQVLAVPAGVNVGDYFRVSVEMKFFSTISPGLSLLQVQANSNSNAQSDYLVQTSRNVEFFGAEQPELFFSSEPQKLLSGTTTFTLTARLGLNATGGTAAAKIGFRNLRIERVDGPV